MGFSFTIWPMKQNINTRLTCVVTGDKNEREREQTILRRDAYVMVRLVIS